MPAKNPKTTRRPRRPEWIRVRFAFEEHIAVVEDAAFLASVIAMLRAQPRGRMGVPYSGEFLGLALSLAGLRVVRPAARYL